MAVGIKVGSVIDEIGTPSFLHAFFSTISAYGEPKGWGSRFPCLINELYQGQLSPASVPAALDELRTAKAILDKLSPSAVVWDIEDRRATPPWGKDISPSIKSLGSYFVTSTGRDLFMVLEEALVDAAENNEGASIEFKGSE